MRIFSQLVLITILLSCANKSKTLKSCAYTFSDFQKSFDTSRYEDRFTDKLWIEAMDKENSFVGRGFYQFDEKLRLRRYAFALDRANNGFYAYYIVTYDTLGQEIQPSKSEVVRWYLRHEGPDSLTVAFYLNMIRHRYEDVELLYGDTSISIPHLDESERFTNLGVAHLKVHKLEEGKKVIVFGNKINTCTLESKRVSDTLTVPREVSLNAANSSLQQ